MAAKYTVPTGATFAKCSATMCGQAITFVRSERGGRMPVNADGVPHWSTCPSSPQFRKRQAQEARIAEIHRERASNGKPRA